MDNKFIAYLTALIVGDLLGSKYLDIPVDERVVTEIDKTEEIEPCIYPRCRN